MTERERDVLDFVRRFIAENGCSPSYQAIGDGIGGSKTRAYEMVASLVQAGFLVRTKRTLGQGSIALPECPRLQAVPSQYLRAELERRGPGDAG